MQFTGDKQGLDSPDKGSGGKIEGNRGDILSNQIVQEAHPAHVSAQVRFQLLQPPMNPDLCFIRGSAIRLVAVLLLTKPPLVVPERGIHSKSENDPVTQP